MSNDILIENGLLIPMTQGRPVIENSSVLISNGIIQDAGRAEIFSRYDVKTCIDAKGKIIMPGLVNCHTHLPMSMFRGFADDLPLDVWLNEHIFPAEAKQVNPETVEKWAYHSCTEMLLSGTTTCCDGYFYEENVVKAVAASGIRAVAGQGIIDFPAPGVPDPLQNINIAVDFVKRTKDRYANIYPSIFCHSAYTCSARTLIKAKSAASDLGVMFQIHAAETENEKNMVKEAGKSSIIEYLELTGVLDENTLLVHGVWIDDDDIELIKKAGAKVAHCPESNMKLASGIAPVTSLIERKVAVGLGTDGCASNNDHDLFGEMDTAAKLHKIALMDPCAMDAGTVLEMATIKGAEAIGLGSVTGSIEKGKKADIILVDTDKPHMNPMYNPFSALVYSAKASDVSLVMVGGRILVQNGKLL